MLHSQDSTNTAQGYTFRRISKRNPCEVCGKPDNCNRVESHDGRELGYYCRRPEGRSGWTWEGNDGGRFFPNPDETGRVYDWRDVAPPVAPLPKREPAPPDALDRIYRRLFAACPISDADRSSIRARGLDPDKSGQYLFGTLGNDRAERNRIAAAMLDGEDPAVVGHVPGIHRRDGRLTLAGAAGLLIAVVNADGLIVGVRIRKPDHGPNRYSWLSTIDLVDGCGSGAPLLVAIPEGCDDFSIAGVVEGEFKAIIAAERTGRPWISVPGVSVIADVLPLVAKLGAAEVWIAYDEDARSKPEVAQAEAKLIAAVIAGGYAAHRLSWPAAWKGLDDALVAGIIPVAVLVSGRENAAELDRWKRQAEDERQYTAAAFAAINSRKNGPQARTAVAIVHDLKQRRIPVGQWTVYTNDRFAAVTGMSERSASTHKPYITEHYGEAVEFKVTPKGDGKDLTYVRLNAAPADALTAIALHDPEIPKNGNGGKREKLACPTCGPDAGVNIESRFRCTGCNTVIATAPPRTFRKRREPMVDTLSTIPSSADMAPLTNTVKTVDTLSTIARSVPRPPLPALQSSPRMQAMEAKWIHGAPAAPPAVIGDTGQVPLIARAQDALTAADHATPDDYDARADLEVRLADVAHSRGRHPDPKPQPMESRRLDPWTADVLYGGWE